MHDVESLLKVLVVDCLGAGLPAVFALGLRRTRAVRRDQRRRHKPSQPAVKYLGIALFLFVAWVIIPRLLDHRTTISPLRC